MDEEKKFIEDIWKRIEEREQEIDILDALDRERGKSMLSIAREFYGEMGVKRLFYGFSDVIVVAMVISVCIFIGVYLYLGLDAKYVYSMLFIFSPTLYASIFCLSFLKEMQAKTFQVQMGCRYTFLHVMVFRMFMNSGMAVMFNIIYICTLNYRFGINLNKALALSFSSLMLFSIILLKALEAKRKILSFAWVNVLWFGVNFLIFHGLNDFYVSFIDQIPFRVLVAAIVLCIACYYRELKKMLGRNYRRRYFNA